MYYKIVNYNLQSAVIKTAPVQYKVNQWVKPNIVESKLMVFDSYKNAQRFLSDCLFAYGSKMIYECEVRNPSKNGIILDLNNIRLGRLEQQLNKVLKLKKQKKKFTHLLRKPPIGTIFCDEVKLIKPISIRWF